MKPSNIYDAARVAVLPALAAVGFAEVEPGDYRRTHGAESDRVLLDPSRSAERFSVMLSYLPPYLSPAAELMEGSPEDIGFPCGPYLTPGGVFRRRSEFRSDIPEHLRASLKKAADALSVHGLPWLSRLRSVEFFLSQVDPDSTLDVALASEAAGRLAEARDAYLELVRTFEHAAVEFPSVSDPFAQRCESFVRRRLAELEQKGLTSR